MDHSKSERKFTRVEFQITATVKIGDRQFEGIVKNLSMHGMFLLTDQKLTVGDMAEVTIVLGGQSENDENEMIVDVKVTRVTDSGIAFDFDKIDFDSYIHLQNLVAFNVGDEEKVHEEMEAFISEEHSQN